MKTIKQVLIGNLIAKGFSKIEESNSFILFSKQFKKDEITIGAIFGLENKGCVIQLIDELNPCVINFSNKNEAIEALNKLTTNYV